MLARVRCPVPGSGLRSWVIRVGGPQRRPGYGASSRLAPRFNRLFSSLWVIGGEYRRRWPTITPEWSGRGQFVPFCGGGTAAAAGFSPPWPTITLAGWR